MSDQKTKLPRQPPADVFAPINIPLTPVRAFGDTDDRTGFVSANS